MAFFNVINLEFYFVAKSISEAVRFDCMTIGRNKSEAFTAAWPTRNLLPVLMQFTPDGL